MKYFLALIFSIVVATLSLASCTSDQGSLGVTDSSIVQIFNIGTSGESSGLDLTIEVSVDTDSNGAEIITRNYTLILVWGEPFASADMAKIKYDVVLNDRVVLTTDMRTVVIDMGKGRSDVYVRLTDNPVIKSKVYSYTILE